MSTEQIKLSGTDAEHFREIRESIAERRNGHHPSNAEVVRRLMEETSLYGGQMM